MKNPFSTGFSQTVLMLLLVHNGDPETRVSKNGIYFIQQMPLTLVRKLERRSEVKLDLLLTVLLLENLRAHLQLSM
jgi:hypothetical protein